MDREHRAETRIKKDEEINQVTQAIIGAAIAVHRTLGPGLLESAYEACLVSELRGLGLKVEQQKPIPLKNGITRLTNFS